MAAENQPDLDGLPTFFPASGENPSRKPQTPSNIWLIAGLLIATILGSSVTFAQEVQTVKANETVEASSGSYLSASPGPQAITAQYLNSHYALGDWAGLRHLLAEKGVVPTTILISDPFSNLHGGEQTGTATYNLFGVDLRLDTKPLLGWRGGQFKIGGAVNFGTSLSTSYVGNSFPIQLADCAGSQPRLTYLYYTQEMAEGRVSLLVGRISLNSVFGEEFAGSEYFKSFTSIAFDLIPQGLFLNVPGAAGYPHATWGSRLRYAPAKHFYVQTAAYNADTKQLGGDKHGLDFSVHGPVFVIGEVGFKHDNPTGGQTRNVKVGGFYTGGTHDAVRNDTVTPVAGLYGFYTVADRHFFTFDTQYRSGETRRELSRWGDEEPERHLGGFASLVVIPENRTNVVPYFASVGLVAYGPSARRPRDYAGVALAYGSNSRAPSSVPSAGASSLPAIPVPPYQETIEGTYGFAVRPGVLFQPDLQYIVHPNGVDTIPHRLAPGTSVPNALALGVNVVINF